MEGARGGEEVGREGERKEGREGGRGKVGVRELEGRKLGGGRREEVRREGGGEARGRTKVGVRELEGRKLGGWSKGGGRKGVVEGVGMREGGMEGWRWRMREGDGGTKRGKEERREPERSRVTS